MEIFFKDEAFVFNRRFVGNSDVSVTLYSKRLGIETVYIPGGQIVKNLPYTYLDRFSHINGVFTKIKEEKIGLYEIDKVKTFGLYVARNIETFEMLTDMSSIIYTYAPYADERIYNLYKKVLFYSLQAEYPYGYYLSFMVKINYLLGVYNPSVGDRPDVLNKLLKTRISETRSVKIDKKTATYLVSALKQNLKRWLE